MASLFQVILGYMGKSVASINYGQFHKFFYLLGIVGIILRFITPLTIAPAIAIIGLALFDVAADFAAKHWGVAAGTIIFMIVFSQYLRNVGFPVPIYKKGKCKVKRIYLFKLFPVILTICTMWIICGIVTAAGGFPEGSPARTDGKLNLLYNADWIRFPYPCEKPFSRMSA